MAMTNKEIIASAAEWRAWGKKFGWRLRGLGDTFHDEKALASFEKDGQRDPFMITAAMRADIDRAIASAKA